MAWGGTVPTFSTDEVLTSTTMNIIGDDVNQLGSPPYGLMSSNGTQTSVSNETWTTITLTTVSTANGMSSTTNALVVPIAGLYLICAYCGFDVTSTGTQMGSGFAQSSGASSPDAYTLSSQNITLGGGSPFTGVYPLVAGASVYLLGYQEAGGSIGSDGDSSYLSATWLGNS